jgi:hypothetical protein
VTWFYKWDIFCLPLLRHNRMGLVNKDFILLNSVPVKNTVSRRTNRGTDTLPLQPSEVSRSDPETGVNTVAGFRIQCDDDITSVGRTVEDGYEELLKHWKKVTANAQRQAW